MGSYSDTQNFYLIDGSELVNVDQDINYNLQRADTRVKPLLEYQVTDEPSVSASKLPKDTGFKWYKTYTNSIWVFRNDGHIYQDPNAQVDSWTTDGLSFPAGYSSMDLNEDRISYSISSGFVAFRGKLVLNAGANDLPTNVTVNFLTVPDAILPVAARYFTVYGGEATNGDFQCARIYIPQRGIVNPHLEFCRYGGAGNGASERYISLNDVWYSLE